MDKFTVGARVKRNPKDFPPNHPALTRVGTITEQWEHGFRVRWDDSPEEGLTYGYYPEELVSA